MGKPVWEPDCSSALRTIIWWSCDSLDLTREGAEFDSESTGLSVGAFRGRNGRSRDLFNGPNSISAFPSPHRMERLT